MRNGFTGVFCLQLNYLKMLSALNDKNESVIPTDKNQKAKCPYCKEKLISRVGKINIPHWAHIKTSNCNSFDKESKTKWHYENQIYFKEQGFLIEQTIYKNDIFKIADVWIDNHFAIEFQHSPISVEEIEKRENHYGKVIWVFDINKIYYEDRFDYDKNSYTWRNPKESIYYCNQPIFLNFNKKYIHITSIKKQFFKVEDWHKYNTKHFYASSIVYNQFDFTMLIKYVSEIYKDKQKFPSNFSNLPNFNQLTLF
jgi:competence CoiA-like predicted nuclease